MAPYLKQLIKIFNKLTVLIKINRNTIMKTYGEEENYRDNESSVCTAALLGSDYADFLTV
jgi:hypothetical protein